MVHKIKYFEAAKLKEGIYLQDVVNVMVHKIKYFEAAKLKEGIYLQDVVNDFLAEKGEKIIAVHPIMEKTLLVHYTE
jgi:hypothetical protein